MHEMPCSLQHWWLTWRGTLLSAHNLIVSIWCYAYGTASTHQIFTITNRTKSSPHPLWHSYLIQLTLSFSRPWRFPWLHYCFSPHFSVSQDKHSLKALSSLEQQGWVIKWSKYYKIWVFYITVHNTYIPIFVILEWSFIVASLRHTCAIIMLSNQHLDVPHLWGGWIISAKEKCSLTQI